MKMHVTTLKQSQSETIVAFLGFQKKGPHERLITQGLPKDMSDWLKRPLKEKIFAGRPKEVLFAPYANHQQHFLFIGLGDLSQADLETVRKASSWAYGKLVQEKVSSASLFAQYLSHF